MSKPTTCVKIGEIEITPGIAEFLQNMMDHDVDRYAANGYIEDLIEVQNLLTRILLGMDDPDTQKVKSGLHSVMAIIDQLNLLVQKESDN